MKAISITSNPNSGADRMSAKGYIYAELDIHDASVFYDDYMVKVRPILERYGAVFLIATNHPKVVEGGRTVRRVILLEFESPERARAFFYSRAYQDIVDIRLESCDAHLYFLDGLPLE
jgi:uncharacterized protein (DUF1330 family)